MKRPILILTLSLFTLLGSALYVAASPAGSPCKGECDKHCDGPGDRKGPHGDRFLARMSKTLDLSETQQSSIRKVQAEEEEKTAILREKKQKNRQQLRQVEGTKPFDENAVRVLAEQRGALETELTIARSRAHSQIDAILTPEQRDLAASLRPEPGEGRNGGYHRR